MATFRSDFAARHHAALAAIAARAELDFLVLDCAETPTGELLLFEIDPGAVVHSMDPDDLFPYKRANMALIYAAFRAMLVRAAGRSSIASRSFPEADSCARSGQVANAAMATGTRTTTTPETSRRLRRRSRGWSEAAVTLSSTARIS